MNKLDEENRNMARQKTRCGECGKPGSQKKTEQWIGCCSCEQWYHMACTDLKKYLDDKVIDLISEEYIHFQCKICKEGKVLIGPNCTKSIPEMITKIQELTSRNERLEHDVQSMKGMLADLTTQFKNFTKMEMQVELDILNRVNDIKNEQVLIGQVRPNPTSYASQVKKSKNTLVIKSNEAQGNRPIGHRQKEIGSILKEIPIEKTKQTNGGHILAEFRDVKTLEEARNKIENQTEVPVTVIEKTKIMPKVVITGVSLMETESTIVDSVLIKNKWLKDLVDQGEEFKLVMSLKPKVDSRAFIFKCSPSIRRQLKYVASDYLYTMYDRCKIYDKYHVLQCFKCQGFGHKSGECREEQICVKCSQNHRIQQCPNEDMKCVNCFNGNLQETEHWANYVKCPKYVEQVAKIRNRTDNGE